MKDLEKYSIEDLEEEIFRRREKLRNVPSPLPISDFSSLREMVIEGINQNVKNGCEDDDFEHDVYEKVIESIYGKDFWEWRNKQEW
jgi:hypothetical protein